MTDQQGEMLVTKQITKKRAVQPWDDSEVDLLLAMISSGMKYRAIALALGRNLKGVQGKADRLRNGGHQKKTKDEIAVEISTELRRQCLKCRSSFISKSIGNRICSSCAPNVNLLRHAEGMS